MTTTPPREPQEREPDPPDLVATRERMRAIWARLDALLAARRKLEES